MPPEQYNEWSPWMKALYGADDSAGMAPNPMTAMGAPPAAASPALNRIADDQTAGTRGVTPQSPTTTGRAPTDPGWYVGAQHPVSRSSATIPLEGQIARDQSELERMNAPAKKASLGQRIAGVVGAAATGYAGQTGEVLAMRDREAARKQAERMDLSKRIDENTRALTTAGVGEEGQNLRARIAAQAQVAAAERLGQTLGARQNIAEEQIQGRKDIAGENIVSREKLAGASQAEKYREFQSTDEYRRWKAQLDNATRLHVAQLQQGKAPAALMQTAVFADGGIKSLNDAERAMAKLEQAGVMGQSWAQNKVEDWVFGKGAVDPSLSPEIRQTIGELRTSLNLAASAMTRAHTQRGSKEVYDDLKTRLGPGQDWSALRGAISESQDMLGQYVTAASDANIQRIRGGGGPTNTPAPQQPTRPPKAGMEWRRNKRTGELREFPIGQ